VLPSSNLDGSLSVLANAVPHDFCGEGTSQLGAFVVGGSQNTSYSWTPGDNLNDPNSAFPVANLQETTQYTVVIHDGLKSASSSVSVKINPIPIPVIEQMGDSIVSSEIVGNQWYSSEGAIEGATGQVFYPEVEDLYYTIVTSEFGCISDPSDTVNFQFTGIPELLSANNIYIYPNPFKSSFNIHIKGEAKGNYILHIYDVYGRRIYSGKIFKDQSEYSKPVSLQSLRSGIYFVSIFSESGNLIYTCRIIRE
jgi:hypothetical protein